MPCLLLNANGVTSVKKGAENGELDCHLLTCCLKLNSSGPGYGDDGTFHLTDKVAGYFSHSLKLLLLFLLLYSFVILSKLLQAVSTH